MLTRPLRHGKRTYQEELLRTYNFNFWTEEHIDIRFKIGPSTVWTTKYKPINPKLKLETWILKIYGALVLLFYMINTINLEYSSLQFQFWIYWLIFGCPNSGRADLESDIDVFLGSEVEVISSKKFLLISSLSMSQRSREHLMMLYDILIFKISLISFWSILEYKYLVFKNIHKDEQSNKIWQRNNI